VGLPERSPGRLAGALRRERLDHALTSATGISAVPRPSANGTTAATGRTRVSCRNLSLTDEYHNTAQQARNPGEGL
jgi:hypothetical protein